MNKENEKCWACAGATVKVDRKTIKVIGCPKGICDPNIRKEGK